MVAKARTYLDTMATAGHSPDVITYTSLMNGMCVKDDALGVGALALLEEMEAKGCDPNERTYNTLLMESWGYARTRNWTRPWMCVQVHGSCWDEAGGSSLCHIRQGVVSSRKSSRCIRVLLTTLDLNKFHCLLIIADLLKGAHQLLRKQH
ncbi:hypothetical protein GUJ93_ZPchr0002g26413 [Zizania palustris]|uniref:Pentatricopeptide repeat-containing protein n=1 Tax=Zizania palustris TaxID=103762 RepID=A0A8J5S4M0_ZIZPA|nr:hypothetical protein GUJ93_ZPchr0002g26413 [Zizania palustris]